ncbi:hypothetical protein U9M48_022872 [Paspalum notatum var. saurae]|uniref:Remorin C-terminal domain-containing protein n=1 Tax=Paspalum notatum var. saurae TaxID=547442 RepID=A0AAQ3TN84_PASNO
MCGAARAGSPAAAVRSPSRSRGRGRPGGAHAVPFCAVRFAKCRPIMGSGALSGLWLALPFRRRADAWSVHDVDITSFTALSVPPSHSVRVIVRVFQLSRAVRPDGLFFLFRILLHSGIQLQCSTILAARPVQSSGRASCIAFPLAAVPGIESCAFLRGSGLSAMRRSSQSQGMMSLSYDAGGGGRKGLLACYVNKAKARPSKWDDAQRWLSSARAAPDGDDDRRRSSCADDRLLLPSAAASQKGRHSWSADADAEAQTKRVDSVLAYGPQQPRCLSLRDMGTEMTPAGSKEPSRANTPRAAATLACAPAPSTAVHAPSSRRRTDCTDGGSPPGHVAVDAEEVVKEAAAAAAAAAVAVSPATAWDAAERAKHMARYRREEMKIQAWENRRRQKAELQMKMTEAKAERMKLRAQEKTASKLASAQAAATAKRALAEAKLSRRAARVRDKADELRRSGSGHLPSSSVFSLKLPLMCS